MPVKMSQIRRDFPMYENVSDEDLLIGLRKKHYADIPMGDFVKSIEFDTARAKANKELTDSMSWAEKADAGIGKAFADIGRAGKRVANMVGVGDYDQKAAQADRDLDAPLMGTGAGMTGNIAGNLAATALPGGYAAKGLGAVTAGAGKLARLPAVGAALAPFVGGAGSGAALGAATSPADMGEGAAIGAAAGGLGEAAGRVGSALYKGGKAAIEPLWEGGQKRVVARTLQRFAGDEAAAAKAAAQVANAPRTVKGVVPTLAEATDNPGLAQLQRASQASSPEAASALQAARDKQLTAYRTTLDEIAGDTPLPAHMRSPNLPSTDRGYVEATRSGNASHLYGQAEAAGVDPAFNAEAVELMQRPSIRSAVKEAQKNAMDRGLDLTGQEGSVRGLQAVKQNLDARISVARRSGDNDAVRSLEKARADLVGYLEKASPQFREAERTFAKDSKVINAMDIAAKLRDKAFPALTDTQGVPSRANANAFASAMREGDEFARKATGGYAKDMAEAMGPQDMARLTGIQKNMGDYAAAGERAALGGSRTAQHMNLSNIIEQAMGPLGMPRGAADTMLGRVTTGLLGLPFKFTQTQTEQLLAKALVDPDTARTLLLAKDPKVWTEKLRPYAAQIATQGALQGNR